MSGYSIHGDWGTTRLRLWRIEGGAISATHEGPGIGALRASPAETLRSAIAPWLTESMPERIALCGMAGSRNGLHEVPYVDCPADDAAWRAAAAALSFDAVPLYIMAGAACREGGRPDVMRGEETQIFGAMRRNAFLRGGRHVAIVPGTHSKWVTLEGGRIVTFRTFLTGELYALLLGSTLLAVSDDVRSGSIFEAFDAGVARARFDGDILGSLFEARAAQLQDGRDAGWAREFLSGLLLGSELVELHRHGSSPSRVSVIGGAELAARYARALTHFGVEAHLLDGDVCALAGLDPDHADD